MNIKALVFTQLACPPLLYDCLHQYKLKFYFKYFTIDQQHVSEQRHLWGLTNSILLHFKILSSFMTLNSSSLKSVSHLIILDHFNKQKANAVSHLEQEKTKKCEKTPPLLHHPPSPEKSFSLTSRANTGATQSIQTTCCSLLKQQQVSQWRSKHKGFTFPDLHEPEKITLPMWMKDGLHHCSDVWSEVVGFQVLAELLPEDDGGRFPFYLWMLGLWW